MGLTRQTTLAVALLSFVTSGHQASVTAPLGAREATILVRAADDLQHALNRAEPGQTIVLESGRTYDGPFFLPRKTGDGWITIRGDNDGLARRVPNGRRVGPADASMMPRLRSSKESVLIAAPGAHHYRLSGLEVTTAPGVFLTNLIDLTSDSPNPDDIPHDFVLERLYVHGDPNKGSRRGLALNSASTSVSDSYFSDFKEDGADSQAICGWMGPGPYTIVNNYLEAAGENIMFGGGDPKVKNLVPSDITIRRNRLAKPLEWRTLGRNGQQQWTVKNLLELKNARRVLIEGNTLEHTWRAAQVGFAVLFTPRNQDGSAPWSVVEDVTFTNNLIRRVANGIHFLGRDDNNPSGQLRNVRVVNNVFEDVGGQWGDGRLFLLIDGTDGVVIDHNTASQTGAGVFAGDVVPHSSFVFSNNIVMTNGAGIGGSGTSPGNASVQHYFPNATIRGNAFVGSDGGSYPSGNFNLASLAAVGFSKPDDGDFRLTASSPLRGKGTDGKDIGADVDQIVRSIGRMASPRILEAGIAVPDTLFWLAALLIGYAYVGYPLVLWLGGRVHPRPVRRARWYPPVTILVIAYNEAARIGRRIQNLENSSYPADRREVIVVSDGSTDDTVTEARLASPNVRVIEGVTRQGKAAIFNHVMPAIQNDIVVLADARQRFAPDAIEALVSNMADPEVGAVSGQLLLTSNENGGTATQGTGLYWRYESWIRRSESNIDSTIGVTGAITAIRRSLFERLPIDTVIDDVLIPLRISRRGYRVVYEPRALAYDGLPAADRDEFRRKARTLSGNFQLFARERWLFRPSENRLLFQTLSHKGIRLLLPLLFALLLAANLTMLDEPVYRLTLGLQVAFYAMAAAGRLSPRLRRRVRWLVLPYTICFLSCATVVAFIRFLRHRETATWDRAAVSEPG